APAAPYAIARRSGRRGPSSAPKDTLGPGSTSRILTSNELRGYILLKVPSREAHMVDGEFDGIVVGGGYHGLTLAGYVAKQGLTTYTDDPHRTYKQFKTVLPKSDLDTLEEVYHRSLRKVEEEFYAAPKPTEERGAGLENDDRKEYQRFCEMTGRELLDTLYEY